MFEVADGGAISCVGCENVEIEAQFIGGIACEACLVGIQMHQLSEYLYAFAFLAMLECRAEDTRVAAIEEVFYNVKLYQDSGVLTTVFSHHWVF